MTTNNCPQCNQRLTHDGKHYCSYCGCPYRFEIPTTPFLIAAYIFGVIQVWSLVNHFRGHDMTCHDLPNPVSITSIWSGICAFVLMVLGTWDVDRRKKTVAIGDDQWIDENVNVHKKIRRKDLILLFILGTAMNALYLWSFYSISQIQPIAGKIIFCGIVYLLLLGCPFAVRKISKKHVAQKLNEFKSRARS